MSRFSGTLVLHPISNYNPLALADQGQSNTRLPPPEVKMPNLLQSNGQSLPFAYGWLVGHGVSTIGNWYLIRDQLESDAFRREFVRETTAPNDSPVKDFQPIIRHVAYDDFAGFMIRDGRVTDEVILVHLTFAGKPESTGFPNLTIYANIWDWLDACVDVDEDRKRVKTLRVQFAFESQRP
jgi:hypothetical protein